MFKPEGIRATGYLRRLDKELKQICKDFEIKNPDYVDDIIDTFFKTVKGYIEDERVPVIHITNLGAFKPTILKINYELRRSFFNFRQGRLSREKLADHVSKVWEVKQRLIKEASGGSTWNEWKDKKLVRKNEISNGTLQSELHSDLGQKEEKNDVRKFTHTNSKKA